MIYNSNTNWFLASIEYASYNSILLIPMLIGLKKYTYNNEKGISIIVTIVFAVLAFLLYRILQTGGIEIHNIEIPLIHIVNEFGEIYRYIYGVVIIFAIYTSAVAAGYSFAENCSDNKKKYKIVCLLICISAIFISNIGFSNLVRILYPVFGLLGLVQLIYILLINKKGLKKIRKTDIK